MDGEDDAARSIRRLSRQLTDGIDIDIGWQLLTCMRAAMRESVFEACLTH